MPEFSAPDAKVSNRNPRAAAAAGMAGWTDSGYYGLPRHGLPYSRPVQLRRHPPPAVRIRAGGDGSSNVFRIRSPGIINVTIGGLSRSEGGAASHTAADRSSTVSGRPAAIPSPPPPSLSVSALVSDVALQMQLHRHLRL